MAKYNEGELAMLIVRTGHAAAAARLEGNMEEFARLQTMREILSRIYEGAGTLKDDLELERLMQSPLQQIAKAGQGIAIAAGSVLLLYLMFFGGPRR